jgi:hypothetical protein
MAGKAELAAVASSAKTRWVTPVFIAIFLIVIPRTHCYWERLGAARVAIVELLVFAAFLVAIVKLVGSIRFAIRNRSGPKWAATRLALFYLAVLFFSALDTPWLDCETFRSPVVTRACYEGTMVTRGLELRANGDLEEWSRSFGLRHSRSGAWRWDGDTLRLAYTDEPSALRYVKRADTLFAIAEPGEESYPRRYLEGWCRGEN